MMFLFSLVAETRSDYLIHDLHIAINYLLH